MHRSTQKTGRKQTKAARDTHKYIQNHAHTKKQTHTDLLGCTRTHKHGEKQTQVYTQTHAQNRTIIDTTTHSLSCTNKHTKMNSPEDR